MKSLIGVRPVLCFLLADTEKIYYKVIEDVLKQFNKPYPWETRMRVLGTTELKCCQIVVDDLKLPVDAKEFHRRFSILGNELLGNCDLLPGGILLLLVSMIVLAIFYCLCLVSCAFCV